MRQLGFFIYFLCLDFLFAQAPEWKWASTIKGEGIKTGHSVAIDSKKNIYVAGRYKDFPIFFKNTIFPNRGYDDIFLIKYDPDGNILWVRTAGGNSEEDPNRVIIDNEDNIIIIGNSLSSSITFGNYTLINPEEFFDAFIVKYDPDGFVQWAKNLRGSGEEEGYDLVADNQGNIYVTGTYDSPFILFANDTLISSLATSSEFFLVKYDKSGNEIWAKSFGSDLEEWWPKITINKNQDLILGGNYSGRFMKLGNTILNNSKYSEADFFIAKFDSSGSILWAKSIGGAKEDRLRNISTDDNDNIYISGEFESAGIMFDSILLINNSFSFYDIFIAKYNTDGMAIWAKSYRTNTNGVGSCFVCSDPAGNIYLTADYKSPKLIIDNFEFESKGFHDIVLAKMDSNANVIWAISQGGNKQDHLGDISIGADNTVCITGYFLSDTMIFGNVTLLNTTKNTGDLFIAKLGETTIGTNEVSNFNINLFPNPASSLLELSSQEFYSDKSKIKIDIFDVQGREIFLSGSWSLDKYIMEVDKLPGGLYFLQIQSEDQLILQKFVVQH